MAETTTAQTTGDRMIGIALESGLVTIEQVRECEEFVVDKRFTGSVVLALFHRGYLEPDEVRKIIDMSLPQRRKAPTLKQTQSVRPRRHTTKTILLSAEMREKQLAEASRAEFNSSTGGDSSLSSSEERVLRYTEIIGPYYLMETLGRGGMGKVVRAYHRDLARLVALKFIDPRRAARADLMRRFEQEAMLAARLHHPNIVAIYDVDFAFERPYIAMEYVEGALLSDLIGPRGMPVEDALRIVERIAGALHYAHERGVIHQDIKPQNIIIDVSGEPRLTDFGLAKRIVELEQTSHEELAWGTPYYMSPEQITRQADRIGPASDIFSLGALMYEMLCGELPFDGEDDQEVLQGIVYREPPSLRKRNPAIDEDVEAIVLKAIEKAPSYRYPTAKGMAEDLRSHRRGGPIIARPYSRGRRWRRLLSRHRKMAWAAGLLVLLLLVGLGYLWEARRSWAASQRLLEAHRRQRLDSLAEAREQLAEGDRLWDRMQTQRRDGDLPAMRALRGQADYCYDVAGYLLAAVYRGSTDRTSEQARALHRRLLRRRLDRADWNDDSAARVRFASALKALGGSPAAPPAEEQATLALTARPVTATFSIHALVERDGQLHRGDRLIHGRAPLARRPLPAGRWLVSAVHPGRAAVHEALYLGPGEHRELTLRLRVPQQIPGDFVYLPGGETIVGGDRDAIHALPKQRLLVGSFLISRYEVTLEEYLAFVNSRPTPEERRRRAPRKVASGEPLWSADREGFFSLPAGVRAARPVTGVSWVDAAAYAAWLAVRHRQRYRLPTSLEWERAARAGDGRLFPWGQRFDRRFCVSAGPTGPAELTAAGAVLGDRSVYGVRDLAGSVREWVADWYAQPARQRMIRGGSYLTGPEWCRAASRAGLHEDAVAPDVGFRVVIDP